MKKGEERSLWSDLYIAASAGVVKVNIETPFEDVNDLKVTVPFVDADGVRIYPDGNGDFVIPAGTQKLGRNCERQRALLLPDCGRHRDFMPFLV